MSATTDRATRKWTEIRFRYLADVRKGRLPSSDDEAGLDAEYAPYLTMEYLRGENSEPTLISVNPDLLIASVDSILLLWDGSNAGEFLHAKWGVVSSTAALITPKFVDPTFFFWVCKGQEDRVRAETVGMGIPHVNGEFLANLRIQLPNLNQQRAIADYLDRETARLDALVTTKERVLGLLEEKRRALITRAVTRGLDPNVPLRDSGIQWLGEIPAHWKTPPVYARFVVQLGKMLDEKRIKGAHLAPYLRNIDVQWGAINTADLPEMDFDEDDRRRYALRVDDILVCEGGEMGRCALWDGTHPECYYQKALHRLRSTGGEDEPAFFVLVMRAIVDSGQFALQSSAATIQHLPAEKLRVVRYPAPPLDEQRAIVAHVALETGKLHALSVATERTIELLRERRAALIVAAVTGQVDVECAA